VHLGFPCRTVEKPKARSCSLASTSLALSLSHSLTLTAPAIIAAPQRAEGFPPRKRSERFSHPLPIPEKRMRELSPNRPDGPSAIGNDNGLVAGAQALPQAQSGSHPTWAAFQCPALPLCTTSYRCARVVRITKRRVKNAGPVIFIHPHVCRPCIRIGTALRRGSSGLAHL